MDVWFCFYVWGTYFLSLHINLIYMHTFKTALNQIIDSGTRKCANFGSLKQLQEQFFIYSKLRLLTNTYNKVYGNLYVPNIKTVFSIMLVQALFITVRLSGRGGFLVAFFGGSCSVVGLVFIVMFVEFTAMVSESSEQFYRWIRQNNKNMYGPYGRKLINSFKVEAVKSGNFYKIQKITCLTVLGFLGNLCGSALISIKI